MNEITFTLPGPPQPKERPRRAADGHWYTPTRTVKAEEAVAYAAMAAGLKLVPDTNYEVEIEFHLSKHRGRPDIDNAGKCVLDGLNRLGAPNGWDDRQVVKLTMRVVTVRDASDEKTVVRVKEGADADPK